MIAAARFPWVAVLAVAVAVAASAAPGAAGALQYDRVAVDGGQWWRLVTGQIVHWTPRMALADLGVVLLAGAWIERRDRRLLAAAVACGTAVVGAGIHLAAPAVLVYRGASGPASTLFVLAALMAARSGSPPTARAIAWCGLILFAGKLLLEGGAVDAIAAGALPEGVAVSRAAHVLGALAAAVVLATRALSDARRRRRPGRPAAAGQPAGQVW